MDRTVKRLEERRLADFFGKGEGGGPDVRFADPAAVAAAVAAGADRELYSAARDVLPSRVVPAPEGQDGPVAGATLWSADLVIYQDGTLPGGEPFRSTGHWNPADQLEIFQVLSGRVLMLCSMLDESGDESYVYFQECRAGDLAVVPFGAWHLTYVLDGPAMVVNTYSGPAGARTAGTATGAGHTPAAKYRSRRGPAEITVTRSGTGFAIDLSATWRRACGDPVRVSCPAWLQKYVPPSGLLTDLHVSATDADLEALLASARASSGADLTEAAELWS
ncbi:hypothetical protein ACFV0O_33090 [Kitasatospora sp. NPDC059577]|uniref:hypothetical protein n=1 Tax=unclassified Kitasatospora TaxID=2633591 RepID=UPI0036B4789A